MTYCLKMFLLLKAVLGRHESEKAKARMVSHHSTIAAFFSRMLLAVLQLKRMKRGNPKIGSTFSDNHLLVAGSEMRKRTKRSTKVKMKHHFQNLGMSMRCHGLCKSGN